MLKKIMSMFKSSGGSRGSSSIGSSRSSRSSSGSSGGIGAKIGSAVESFFGSRKR